MGFSDLDCLFQLIFILSALLNIVCGAVDSALYVLNVQREVTVQRGLCVYVPCRFTTQPDLAPSINASGIWHRDSGLGTVFTAQDKSRIPENNKGRILFTGDATKNDCSMSINEAQSEDTGWYVFRFNDGPRSWEYTLYQLTLTILDLTQTPVISPVKALVAGEEVTLTCESPGQCAVSSPVITWSGRIERPGVTFNTTHPDGNRTFYSNITFTPSKEDHQTSLTCTVSFPRSSASTSTSKRIELNVEYPPVASVTVADAPPNTSLPVVVMEGRSVSLNCTADSYPPASISWHRDDKLLDGTLSAQTLTYELRNAAPNDTGTYRCSVNNNRGADSRSFRINVEYSPRTPQIRCSVDGKCSIDGNNTTEAKEGSSLSLQCSTDSSPTATLTWIKPGKLIRESSNGQMSLSNIALDDDGLYTCRANNTHGASNASVTIRVTYSPRSVPGLNSTCQESETSIGCSCIIQSFPEPTIQWMIDEKSYSSSDKDIYISTSREGSVTNSTLTLQITKGKTPLIVCRSSNRNGGMDLVLIEKISNSVFPLAVVVSAVIVATVLLVLGLIVLLYFRKRKSKQENQDTKDLTGANSEVIYSNSPVYGNIGYETAEESKKNNQRNQNEGSESQNDDEVQYVSIVFPKQMSSRPTKTEEPETEYAAIKRQ